jgi:hypothetical protein
MTESRVESVIEGAVAVTDDPDGVIGALIGALLAEPDRIRLQTLVRGTQEALELAGLRIQRFRSALDLVYSGGSPIWSVTHRDATAAIRGDLVERLVEQAYEHRRAAATAAFPVGGQLAHGRYTLTERLRGTPDRGMYRAQVASSTTPYLVTLSSPQRREFSELRAQLALAAPGIAALEYIGRLEPHSEAGYEAMIEVEPPGVSADQLALPLAPSVAAALTLQVAHIVAAAHTAGGAIGGLRPELIYLDSLTRPTVTGIAPRAEQFWLTAAPRSYGVPACFDQFFQAPEQLAQPFDRPAAGADVFALGALLVYWLTGQHPFDGEGMVQAMSIAIGRRRASARVAPAFEGITSRALMADPTDRSSLDALIRELEG